MKPSRPSAAKSSKLPDFKLRAQVRLAEEALQSVIRAAFGAGKPADRALSMYFRDNRQCGARDRQFISETVYAVWRNWGVLRKLIAADRRAGIEDGKLGPAVREIDMFLFGAIYLEKLKFPAADMITSEAFGFDWPGGGQDDYAGRAGRLLTTLGAENTESAGERDLIPDWVRSRLSGVIDLDAYAASLRRRPPMWLRNQSGNIDQLASALHEAGLSVLRHDRMPDALAAENPRINLFTLPEFRSGRFEVQDLASQVIGRVANPKPGERWLDACAGAGGKSLQLAELMQRKGTVVATDIRAYKLDDLKLRARRSGFPNIQTKEWDGKPLKGKQCGQYDGVLVDAPCSCSGVWRRNPDGCWTLREPEIAEMAELQFNILSAASSGVKPRGALVYATCSVFPEENTGVIERFLAAHPNFRPAPFENPLTGETVASGHLQVMPSDGDCDAMFVARFIREQ